MMSSFCQKRTTRLILLSCCRLIPRRGEFTRSGFSFLLCQQIDFRYPGQNCTMDVDENSTRVCVWAIEYKQQKDEIEDA